MNVENNFELDSQPALQTALVAAHPAPVSFAEIANDRYEIICDLLQLDMKERPVLEVMTATQAIKMKFNGVYSPGPHRIRISPLTPNIDYTLLHELAHAVCRREMRYMGSHGVPYVALHDLMIAHFFNNSKVAGGTVVDDQWSRLGLDGARNSTKKEAAEIVKRVLAVYPVLVPQPSVSMLAEEVAKSTASKYCFNWTANKWALVRWFDLIWTQKRAVIGYVGMFLKVLCLIDFAALFVAVALSNSVHREPSTPDSWVAFFMYGLLVTFSVAFVYDWLTKKFAGYDHKDFK